MLPAIFARTLVLTACMIVTSGYLAWASRSEEIPPRSSFTSFPMRFDDWTGRQAPPLDPSILAVLGVDEHVNRYYASGDRLAHLYVGYYQSQREGGSIHSPMNCLPGAGWLPVQTGRIDIAVPAADGSSRLLHVNRYVIQKGLEKQLVLYWYQSHGRVEPSEYWSKVYLVLDSMRLNRTDAALIRVIAPLADSDSAAAEAAAEQTAVEFVKAAFPLLDAHLPL